MNENPKKKLYNLFGDSINKSDEERVPSYITIGNILRERTKNMSPKVSYIMAKDVPILVDAVKDLKPRVTRCVYFTIEAVLPEVAGLLSFEALEVPFFMLGLSGVICQPDGNNTRFTDPNQIDVLFDKIEDKEGLVVAVSDIFLPTYLLRTNKKDPPRGDVFRIGLELMLAAFMFRAERIDFKKFDSECKKLRTMVNRSEEEGSVFRKWSEWQVNRSRDNYDRQLQEGIALPWEELK